MSDYAVSMREEAAAENKEYFDMLNDVDARQRYFGALTAEDPTDISTIKDVKSKIA